MRRGLVGLSLATGGCLVLNPAYDGSSDSDSGDFASVSGRPTSDADASSSGASGDSGSMGGTATGGESTGFDTTGAVATTGSTGIDGSTGTTAIEPGVAVIPADIATCVLQPFMDLPYQGPDQCEFLVTVELVQDPAQRDGLIVDRQFDDAQGRPAWGVLRFDLSQVPNGATITAASLALTASASPYQNFPIGASGRLRPTDAFDTATLAVSPPVVGVGEVSIGPTSPGDLKILDVTALVGQGTAAVHLAIEPEEYSGRIYMSKASNAPPTLTISWQ
jgi:hypothetical protein